MSPGEAREWGRGDRRRIPARDFPGEVLALVDERQGGRRCDACHAAGRTPPASEPLELDHRQPIALGGDNHWLNLRWLCRSCNRGRGTRPGTPGRPAWTRRR